MFLRRQDFMAGRNLKIVELNGVTSEATHIYDPKLSLFDAYRVLFEQWRIAFEIGDLNRARGIRPASVGELLQCDPRVSPAGAELPGMTVMRLAAMRKSIGRDCETAVLAQDMLSADANSFRRCRDGSSLRRFSEVDSDSMAAPREPTFSEVPVARDHWCLTETHPLAQTNLSMLTSAS